MFYSQGLVLKTLISLTILATKTMTIQSEYKRSYELSVQELASQLEIGDLVFINVSALPFQRVSSTTGSWTNHVGIVIELSGKEPIIAESRFPYSSTTTLSRFVARSEHRRMSVNRLNSSLTVQQRVEVVTAAKKRIGILYDTGFNLNSHRQFCSRYVREILFEATGIKVGDVETFSTLLTKNPNTDLKFWRLWYFGNIPWQRETVTPASLLRSAKLHTIFNGFVSTKEYF